MLIKLTDVNIKKSPQPRGVTVRDVVDDYMALMTDGHEFPPVEVYRVGKDLILVDGFHRFYATSELGRETIEATITGGTMQEAVLATLRSNQMQKALRVSNQMKSNYVECALRFSLELDMNLSDRSIAGLVCVSHPTVAKVRRELFPERSSAPSPRQGDDGHTRSMPKQRPAPAASDEEIRVEADSEPDKPHVVASDFSAGPYGNAPAQKLGDTPPRRATAAATATKPVTGPEPLNPVAAAVPGDSAAFLKVAALVDPQLHKRMRDMPHEVKELAKLSDEKLAKEAAFLVFGKRWKVKHAIHFLKKEITEENRIYDLIHRCIAAGGTFEMTISSHVIAVTKPGGYDS